MYVKRRAQRFRQGRGTGNESETNRNPETHMSKNVEYRNEMDVRSERNRSSRGSGNWKWARMSERARHTGEGVARRKAHQERQRDEREQREEADRAAGTALPPEEGGVELVSADDVLNAALAPRERSCCSPSARRTPPQRPCPPLQMLRGRHPAWPDLSWRGALMTLRPRASTSPGSCVSTLARRTVWQGQLRGRGLSEEYSHPFKDAVSRPLSFVIDKIYL